MPDLRIEVADKQSRSKYREIIRANHITLSSEPLTLLACMGCCFKRAGGAKWESLEIRVSPFHPFMIFFSHLD